MSKELLQLLNISKKKYKAYIDNGKTFYHAKEVKLINIKILALTFTFIEMALSILLYFNYDKDNGGFQFIDYFDSWIPFESFRAQYLVGVDGLSAPLILLTGILGFCAVIASLKINFREREYFMWLLILQGVITGVFSSLDLLLLFVFWEAELIPMYFLISIWGSGKAHYSAMKFLIFTLTSGAFLLIGILSIYFATGTFVMYDINELNLTGISSSSFEILIPSDFKVLTFLCVALFNHIRTFIDGATNTGLFVAIKTVDAKSSLIP